MKGQINLEFLASAFVYLLALGVVLTVSSNILPDFNDSSQTASLNTEAYEVTTKMLTEPGYSTASGGTVDWSSTPSTVDSVSAFGLTNDSEDFLQVKRNKLQALESFTPFNPTGKVNYSDFKRITDVKNQFLFNFTWKPIVDTSQSFTRGQPEMRDSIAYYRMEDTSGDVSDYSVNNTTATNNGASRGAEGAFTSNGFSFDGTNDDVISNDPVSVPQNYSIFTWIKGNFSDQDAGTNVYVGGWNSKIALSVRDFYDTPRTGIIIRNEADSSFHIISNEMDILDNKWHHFGATVNRANGFAKVYLDGNMIINESFPDHWNGSENLILGSYSDGYGHFEGNLDETRFYSTALSQDQVDTYYEERIPYHIAEPQTGYYQDSANKVHYGKKELNGETYYFLNSASNGRYNTSYVSEDWNFTDDTPIGEGDRFNLYGESFNIEDIQNRQRDRGSLVALSQHLKTFGPHVDSDSSVVRMDRFATMEGEPLHLKVLTW